MASNSLDEYIIRDLLLQDAKLDSFGVGENLITSKNEPVFGGVYKLVAIENDNGELIPKIKLSETAQKITTPGFKEVYRFYGRDNGKALADYIVLAGEEVDDTKPITIFDPNDIWKKKTLTNFRAEKLQVQIFKKGVQCYTAPSLEEIRSYSAAQMDTLWDEIKRFEYPHTYYVDLSQKLWETKQRLMEEMNQQ
jgi:nicotinate phosphoribosyltransferase